MQQLGRQIRRLGALQSDNSVKRFLAAPATVIMSGSATAGVVVRVNFVFACGAEHIEKLGLLPQPDNFFEKRVISGEFRKGLVDNPQTALQSAHLGDERWDVMPKQMLGLCWHSPIAFPWSLANIVLTILDGC